MRTQSSILAGESHGQRSLAGYSPWDCNKSDMTARLGTHMFCELVYYSPSSGSQKNLCPLLFSHLEVFPFLPQSYNQKSVWLLHIYRGSRSMCNAQPSVLKLTLLSL